MKIGIFTNNYLPNPYGVTGSVETFRREFERRGHTVYIFAANWPGYVDKNENVFRYPSLDINFKFRFPIAIPFSRKMDKIIEKLDLDIIHSQHPNLLGGAAKKWAKKKKIPLVFTWHTLYDKYANYVSFLPEKLVGWWTIRNARIYANKVDQVIVPTESVVPILRKWGVTNQIEAISTGVDEELFQDTDRIKTRSRFSFKESDKVILLLSRLTEEKNVEFIFNSLLDILKNHQDVKFLVVGGGYLQEKFENWAKENNLQNQVFFTGEVKREEVKNFYVAADIFVYSSLSETQGTIITEAIYMGLPIVAVRATGISSLVEDKRSGFLTRLDEKEFSEKVQFLLENKEIREEISKTSKKIAQEKYTAEACGKKMLDVYQKLISENKK